jgi:hypothetical protein
MEENISKLEDELDVCSFVAFNRSNKWSYKIYSMTTDEIYEQSSGYETKNEAKKACLDKLIELELAK